METIRDKYEYYILLTRWVWIYMCRLSVHKATTEKAGAEATDQQF